MSSHNHFSDRDIRKNLFFEKRMVSIIGDIDEVLWQDFADLMSRFVVHGAPDIIIWFASSGGNVDIGLDMYDMLHTYPGHKTGIVMNKACSIASVVLQACDERLCAEHATVRIHDLESRLCMTIARSKSKLTKWLKENLDLQERIYRIYTGRTGRSLTEIRRLCAKDEPMTLAESMKLGFVDRVLGKDDMARWFRPDILQNIK